MLLNILTAQIFSILVSPSISELCEVIDTYAGSLTTPNYPSDYPNNADCLYFFSVPFGYALNLTVVEFDLDFEVVQNNIVCHDYIQVMSFSLKLGHLILIW